MNDKTKETILTVAKVAVAVGTTIITIFTSKSDK